MGDFVSLSNAINPHIHSPFSVLPLELQALWKERVFLFQWDELAPLQRVSFAQQQDFQQDCFREQVTGRLWPIADCRGMVKPTLFRGQEQRDWVIDSSDIFHCRTPP